MSSTGLPFGARSIAVWKKCRATSMPGCASTTRSDHIRAAGVTARLRLRPLSMRCRWHGRKYSPLLHLSRVELKGDDHEWCVAQQSRTRLPNCRTSRSDGRSQERRQPASVSERTLDGGPARRLSDALLKSDTGAKPYSLSEQVLSSTHYEQVQTRRVANDAMVTVGAARYSVPVEFVGQTVSVHE